jgi:isopentenyldiphosphate isomerase
MGLSVTTSGLSGYARPVATPVQQNDPTERLEILDRQGRPTGVGKSREAIHLEGHWHKTFQCWIVRRGPAGPEIVLQGRALTKDTFPGFWDTSSAGHWRFGERPEEAARELEEELGLVVSFERLAWVGQERMARAHANGLVDREFHQVYALVHEAPLASYQPDPKEVSAVAAILARDLLRLARGEVERVLAREAVTVSADGLQPWETWIERDRLVPYPVAQLRRLTRAANRLLAV